MAVWALLALLLLPVGLDEMWSGAETGTSGPENGEVQVMDDGGPIPPK